MNVITKDVKETTTMTMINVPVFATNMSAMETICILIKMNVNVNVRKLTALLTIFGILTTV